MPVRAGCSAVTCTIRRSPATVCPSPSTVCPSPSTVRLSPSNVRGSPLTDLTQLSSSSRPPFNDSQRFAQFLRPPSLSDGGRQNFMDGHIAHWSPLVATPYAADVHRTITSARHHNSFSARHCNEWHTIRALASRPSRSAGGLEWSNSSSDRCGTRLPIGQARGRQYAREKS